MYCLCFLTFVPSELTKHRKQVNKPQKNKNKNNNHISNSIYKIQRKESLNDFTFMGHFLCK